MATPETTFDLSQCAAGLADAAVLMAEAAQHLSEAARAMCYVSPPGSNVLPDVANQKNGGLPGFSGEGGGLSNHQSDTEDASTGNNVHRPESPAEILELHDQSLRSPAFGAPNLTDQDELCDAVLLPGRYFIILEEEFDILPLITAYASICRKMLYCMPFIEASQSWRVLISLQVRIQDTIMNAHHTCAIVTPQEYEISHIKAYFASLGFTEYPKSALIKQFDVTSLLSESRKIVQLILYDHSFYGNIHYLYKASLGFYNNAPSKSIRRSATWAAQLANAFAAKILLHGRVEDGCSRFKPDGMMLPVDRETIRKLGLKRAVQLGLIIEDPVSLDDYQAAPSRSTVQRENTLTLEPVGKWYMVLEEDFDATLFILYQMEQHLKVICFISYGSTAQPYQNIHGQYKQGDIHVQLASVWVIASAWSQDHFGARQPPSHG
ncbi:unnamed protein product [Rhizoctonia solani]|uniref:Uncharacterized protein n=1 Tax=Rhizoctonia solani TaxID=456999 RepID=A0A8H3B448_9AGAM|nr:unnamed protein product [Rhizoctonia solani]